MEKLGKSKAIKLINCMFFDEIYDYRVKKIHNSIAEIEDFDFEWLVNYLAELEIPYDVLEDFFKEDIIFADIQGKPTEDDPDYFGIDENGEIYCWTETAGTIYYLKDYGKEWKEL